MPSLEAFAENEAPLSSTTLLAGLQAIADTLTDDPTSQVTAMALLAFADGQHEGGAPGLISAATLRHHLGEDGLPLIVALLRQMADDLEREVLLPRPAEPSPESPEAT